MKKVIIGIIVGIAIISIPLVFAASIQYFSDESSFATWFASSVKKMKNHGIMNGYSDGTFGPTNPATRTELAVMFDRFASVMGKTLYETRSEACDLEMATPSSLILILQDQKGNPIQNAKISVQKWEGLPSDTSFQENSATPGTYNGIYKDTGAGYYTFKIEKAGFTSHIETIKFEAYGECELLIPQTKTIMLIQI